MTAKKIVLSGLVVACVQVFAATELDKSAQAEVITKTYYTDYHKIPDCCIEHLSLTSVDDKNLIDKAAGYIKTALTGRNGHVDRVSCKFKIENGLVHEVVFDKNDNDSLLLLTKDSRETKRLSSKHVNMPRALMKI